MSCWPPSLFSLPSEVMATHCWTIVNQIPGSFAVQGAGDRLKQQQKQCQGSCQKKKSCPVWVPQWHVKECRVSSVPTLPVAGALCQHPFPPVPSLGSGQCDSSQTPIMCQHQAACPFFPDPWGNVVTVPDPTQKTQCHISCCALALMGLKKVSVDVISSENIAW